MQRIEGLLLAAGEGRRMGAVKPLLKIGDETFIGRLCHVFVAVLERVIVVAGHEANRIQEALAGYPGVEIVVNTEYWRGQLSSLKAGLNALSGSTDAVMLHLADQPLVKAETITAMKSAWLQRPSPIAIARYRGKRGHPVIFAREVFPELLAAPESEGARSVVNRDPTRVSYVDVEDPGVTCDFDLPEDLRAAGLPMPENFRK